MTCNLLPTLFFYYYVSSFFGFLSFGSFILFLSRFILFLTVSVYICLCLCVGVCSWLQVLQSQRYWISLKLELQATDCEPPGQAVGLMQVLAENSTHSWLLNLPPSPFFFSSELDNYTLVLRLNFIAESLTKHFTKYFSGFSVVDNMHLYIASISSY